MCSARPLYRTRANGRVLVGMPTYFVEIANRMSSNQYSRAISWISLARPCQFFIRLWIFIATMQLRGQFAARSSVSNKIMLDSVWKHLPSTKNSLYDMISSNKMRIFMTFARILEFGYLLWFLIVTCIFMCELHVKGFVIKEHVNPIYFTTKMLYLCEFNAIG